MENGAANGHDGKDPSSFLSDIIGNAVTVKLNSGVVYKGESAFGAVDSMGADRMARRTAVCGWIHEHRAGEDGRMGQWDEAEGVWRCIRAWKQR